MLLFIEGPRLSLTAAQGKIPIFTGTSPQFLPKPLPAVMLHHLHYGVNALHKERVEDLPWEGQHLRHQVLAHICVVLGPLHCVTSPLYRCQFLPSAIPISSRAAVAHQTSLCCSSTDKGTNPFRLQMWVITITLIRLTDDFSSGEPHINLSPSTCPSCTSGWCWCWTDKFWQTIFMKRQRLYPPHIVSISNSPREIQDLHPCLANQILKHIIRELSISFNIFIAF